MDKTEEFWIENLSKYEKRLFKHSEREMWVKKRILSEILSEHAIEDKDISKYFIAEYLFSRDVLTSKAFNSNFQKCKRYAESNGYEYVKSYQIGIFVNSYKKGLMLLKKKE